MNMKQLSSAGLAVGLSLCACPALPALAGDWNNGAGSIKDTRRVAVPVPAPVPVPEIASGYYFRLDAAYSSSNTRHYQTGYPALDNARNDDGLDQFGRYGFGFGYYFHRWFRGDFTFDARSEARGKFGGFIDYPEAATNFAMRDTIFERSRYRDYTALANGYIDIPVTPRFTPYVGAGIGVGLQVIDRRMERTVTCIDTVDCDTAAGNQPGPQVRGFTLVDGRNKDFSLAYAFMTGFTWQVTDNGKADLGYRMLHIDGLTVSTGSGTVKMPDQNIHEFRIGYRYDVN